jgi:hypothetical protein
LLALVVLSGIFTLLQNGRAPRVCSETDESSLAYGQFCIHYQQRICHETEVTTGGSEVT